MSTIWILKSTCILLVGVSAYSGRHEVSTEILPSSTHKLVNMGLNVMINCGCIIKGDAKVWVCQLPVKKTKQITQLRLKGV